eukprot:261594-Karenia_brevis.AAC.1
MVAAAGAGAADCTEAILTSSAAGPLKKALWTTLARQICILGSPEFLQRNPGIHVHPSVDIELQIFQAERYVSDSCPNCARWCGEIGKIPSSSAACTRRPNCR